MRRIALLLLLPCLALPVHAAPAAQWRRFHVSSATGSFYFDAATVEKADGRVTVLIEQRRDPAQTAAGGVARIAVRDRFDCRDHTLQPLEIRTYAPDGAVLSHDVRDKPPFEPAADTPGAEFVRIACLADFPALTHPDAYDAQP